MYSVQMYTRPDLTSKYRCKICDSKSLIAVIEWKFCTGENLILLKRVLERVGTDIKECVGD